MIGRTAAHVDEFPPLPRPEALLSISRADAEQANPWEPVVTRTLSLSTPAYTRTLSDPLSMSRCSLFPQRSS